MATSFRQSRFRRGNRTALGEDVNPSAYIVNLADCMLVLACGFLVAMMVHWNIDVRSMEELESESLEEVDPMEMPEDIGEGGSYYVEAGTVYRDPSTGALYMIAPEETVDDINASGALANTEDLDSSEADAASDAVSADSGN